MDLLFQHLLYMWPFKKKAIAHDKEPATFNSIICIPGRWTTREEVILKIVEANMGEFIAAGGVMMNIKTKSHCTIEVYEHDERMGESFEVAGRVTCVSEEFLNEIGNHNLVVYISAPTGNLENLERLAFAANAVLKAGGIGVKIETAGKAFDKETWQLFLNDFRESNLYDMFVLESITMEDGTVFSCGMQNLGLKDTIVSVLPFQEAVDLIRIFGFYQVVDKPTILTGQTFSATVDAPKFRILEEQNPPYKGDEQLGNPFGMWRLTKA
jgi:hypothetical protein